MRLYLESRKLLDCDQFSPLFIDSERSCLPITRDKIIQHLRELLHRSRFCGQNYSSHSFRIGAATTAAAAGIEDHVFNELGRWSSDCCVRYVCTDRQIIQSAQNNMCHHRLGPWPITVLYAQLFVLNALCHQILHHLVSRTNKRYICIFSFCYLTGQHCYTLLHQNYIPDTYFTFIHLLGASLILFAHLVVILW